MLRLALCASLTALGCGPRAGGATGASGPTVPSIPVAPLTLHRLTGAGTGRGLVLAAGGAGRAAPIPLAGVPTTVEITLAQGAGGPTLRLTVAPAATPASATAPAAAPAANAAPAAPTGPVWTTRLAAAEDAAFQALALRSSDFTVTVTVTVTGNGGVAATTALPDPPTSASLAVALLAGLTGVALDGRATVLAEVRPDGTLAPLADPVAELDRATRRGARRLVLPLGGGRAPATPGGAPLDLVKRAAHAGAAASIAADLPQAYRALTGGPLPDATPSAAGDLALGPAEIAALDAAYRRHLARLAEAWPRIVEQENRAGLPSPVAALLDVAAHAGRSAERLRLSLAPAAAYLEIAAAVAAADAAVHLDSAVVLTHGGDTGAARAAIDAARAAAAAAVAAARSAAPHAGEARGLLDQLRAAGIAADLEAAASSADEAAASASAAVTALAPLAAAGPAELATRETSRRVAEALAPTLVAAARAAQHALRATDRAALEPGGGPTLSADPATLGPGIARLARAWRDDPPTTAPAQLASALAVAERAALQHSAAARVAVGSIPLAARIAYQAAHSLAAGDLREQIAALALYRVASAECRIAIDLELTSRPGPDPPLTPTPTLTPAPPPSPGPPPPTPPPAPAPAPSS